ncbi:FUSC family membrane protein [Maridesulfovibrio sp.]|uniref:FUSC family membrane protein n=1 Tax=Maridesulfovibrio sp. TaxID=2795000 RepID=UPI0029F4958B|nr:FUSC family membrane protein [Maridesulfovibrio sp.]
MKLVSEFYRIFIRPVDPGLFMTKYAAKSICACLVALMLAYMVGMSTKFVQWSVYGSMVVVVFRAGSTLTKRKAVARWLTFAVMFLVPCSTVIGNHNIGLELYLFLLAFAVFFVQVLGVAAGTAAIGTLIVNLLALTSPDTLLVGLERSGAVLFGSTVAYVFVFYLWPINPEKILTRAGAVALTDIGDYFRAVASSSGRKEDLQQIAEIHDRSVESVRRYRRFMEAMNVDPVKELGSYEGPSGLYALLVRMIEAVVGLSNSRKFAEHSAVFKDMRFKFSDLTGRSAVAFDVLAAGISTGKGEVDLRGLDEGIAELESELLRLGAYNRDDELRDEFLEAWGAVYGLRNLSIEFAEMSKLFCKGGVCSVR